MTGFELRASGVGSDLSANWATTTAQEKAKFTSILRLNLSRNLLKIIFTFPTFLVVDWLYLQSEKNISLLGGSWRCICEECCSSLLFLTSFQRRATSSCVTVGTKAEKLISKHVGTSTRFFVSSTGEHWSCQLETILVDHMAGNSLSVLLENIAKYSRRTREWFFGENPVLSLAPLPRPFWISGHHVMKHLQQPFSKVLHKSCTSWHGSVESILTTYYTFWYSCLSAIFLCNKILLPNVTINKIKVYKYATQNFYRKWFTWVRTQFCCNFF